MKNRAEVLKGRKTTKTISSILFFCCAAALLICCAGSALALEIKRDTLPNGLKVVHVERHNLPVVMATLLVEASPLDEKPEKAGTAFLTAKMLSEGTEKRTAQEISEAMDFIGASLESSTGSDFTTISLSILKKDVETGFDLLSDIILNPRFPEDRLARQKELIKGALKRKEDDPSYVASRAFIREVFGDHPYGRLITGSVETIDQIKREDLISFYKTLYSSHNATLVVVGDITPEELKSLTGKYLGQWNGGDTVRRQPAKEADEKGRRLLLIQKDITQANIIMGHAGVSRDNPDYYAVSVMNYILGGGGFSSRLMRVIRDEMGLTYGIFSSYTPNKEPGPFEVEVQTKNEAAKTVINETIRQINAMRTEPVSDQELEDARAYLTGSFPRRLETSRRVADFLSSVEFYGLGDDYIEKYPEYINRVTKEDVLRVAKKHLRLEELKIVVVGNREKTGLSDLQSLEDIK